MLKREDNPVLRHIISEFIENSQPGGRVVTSSDGWYRNCRVRGITYTCYCKVDKRTGKTKCRPVVATV